MKYLLEAFDKNTDLQEFVVELPHDCEEELEAIMQWPTKQQGWEGYDLTAVQLSAIEALVGRALSDPFYYFQLTCNA